MCPRPGGVGHGPRLPVSPGPGLVSNESLLQSHVDSYAFIAVYIDFCVDVATSHVQGTDIGSTARAEPAFLPVGQDQQTQRPWKPSVTNL